MKNLAAVSHTYLELVKGLFNTTKIDSTSEGTNYTSEKAPTLAVKKCIYCGKNNPSDEVCICNIIESFDEANSEYNKTMFKNMTYSS